MYLIAWYTVPQRSSLIIIRPERLGVPFFFFGGGGGGVLEDSCFEGLRLGLRAAGNLRPKPANRIP